LKKYPPKKGRELKINFTQAYCTVLGYRSTYHDRGSVEQLPGDDGQLLRVELLQLLVQLLCLSVLLFQLFYVLLFHPLENLLLLKVLCKLLCVDLEKSIIDINIQRDNILAYL
jgi:hypothetical protein